jgi:hypothetical protein
MSDNIVMKVSQRKSLSSVARSVARHDRFARAGLDYIHGPKNVHDMSHVPPETAAAEGGTDGLRGLYAEGTGQVYIATDKYPADTARTTVHELSHAAARRFWMDVENHDISPSVDKKLAPTDDASPPIYEHDAEEARNRLLDQKRGMRGGKSKTDQALEDFAFVREYTHAGFNDGDTGERFRGARKREEDLMTLNDAMEEHFAKYGGGK